MLATFGQITESPSKSIDATVSSLTVRDCGEVPQDYFSFHDVVVVSNTKSNMILSFDLNECLPMRHFRPQKMASKCPHKKAKVYAKGMCLYCYCLRGRKRETKKESKQI